MPNELVGKEIQRANDESVWKRLTRLFKSGPVVRHKIAAGEKFMEPRGTARAYKKELSSLYVHSLASYGQYERLSRYADYSEMEFTPEIHSALDIYADETTATNDEGEILKVISKNPEIKQIVEQLFFEILDIEFNLWAWVRNLCKHGDFVLFVDASEENGILNLLPIPINEIEREEGYDKNDPFAVRFRWLTQGNMVLQNWQIIHFRLLGNDNFLPYGCSIIESARRIWRQLILIEDAMLVYRIVRSPERRVFKIDVGNVPPGEIDQFMEQIKTRLRRNQIVDPTSGRVDLRYNPLSVDEDYFIPVRGDKSSDISTLAGGQFTGDIDDVQYIQNKLFSALKVPKAHLGYEAELGSKATLAQQDVRFARTIERVQKIVIAELNKIAIVHLYLLGYNGDDLVDFTLKLANTSTIAEQQKLELWRARFEIAGTAQEGILDRTTIYRKIFNMNDEEIELVHEGKKADKLEDLTLEAMQAPPEQTPQGGEMGGETPEPTPGEEQLPTTLGGDEGGGQDVAPEAGGEQQVQPEGVIREGVELALQNVSEKPHHKRRPNKGSTGVDSIISVNRGKSLFGVEDPAQHVIGRDKQTASDPNDTRAISRLISRPFSEKMIKNSSDPSDEYLKEVIRKTEKLQNNLDEAMRTFERRQRSVSKELRRVRRHGLLGSADKK